MQPPFTIFPLGDGALTVDFGNRIDEALNQNVLRLFRQLQYADLPFVRDLIPAYASLTVYYDVTALRTKEQTAFAAMKERLLSILEGDQNNETAQSRRISIPVCYAKNYAPDLEELAAQKGLSVADVVRLHTAKTYRVYMIGFLPGFAYMGAVNQRIAAPRKAQPRAAVPAGSVGIAGGQTGVYPLASPGGWNLIGQTPLKLFDAARAKAALLQPGDEIRFYPITEDEFTDHQGGAF